MDPATARKNWRTLEPLHGFIYFAAEAHAAYEALGLEGRSGYFASRSAPMGAVPAEVVRATFFNFHPDLVAAAMAGVWEQTSPAAVVDARLGAVDAVLRRVAPEMIDSVELDRANELVRQVSEACDCVGRPLAAGHQSLPRPGEPHLAFWHDLAVVREYRGDGHIAALVSEGLSSLDALVLHAASGEVGADVLRTSRRWSEAEWADGVAALAERGLVTADGSMTDDGSALRAHIETKTDLLAAPAWSVIGQDGCDELRRTARPWSKAVLNGGVFG